ncbi:MAG: DNA replication/repair protein RecF [Alphaproteobacteria bacterium]|jgi:DNA replication and repair protein RecF|nr:AAA family ATPase [Alphaproteobacteria bacterium]
MINSLTLTNFRNHTSSRINSKGHKNIVITGPNGSGKTAILEAISIMSGTNGLRGAPMSELSRINSAGGFSVYATLDNETSLSISYNTGDSRRKLRIDDDSMPLSAAAKLIRIIWLTPKEDRLFVESASDRRAFLDRLITGFDPIHSGRVARLSKLLSERALALKNKTDDNWLKIIEKQLSEVSASIAAARIMYAASLNYFLELETNAQIVLSGWFESKLATGQNCIDVEKEYLDYLSTNRQFVSEKMIIDGVHKSDFSIFCNNLNMNANMLSAGQQKKLLMLMIISNVKLLNAKTNIPVIILLDEVISHLDSESRTDLFNKLDSTPAQVWITGTDEHILKNIKNALFVSCMNGYTCCKLKV